MRFVGGSIDMLNSINERMNFLFGTKKILYTAQKIKNINFWDGVV